MSEVKTYRKHLFVCCTEGCCGARAGEAVYRSGCNGGRLSRQPMVRREQR